MAHAAMGDNEGVTRALRTMRAVRLPKARGPDQLACEGVEEVAVGQAVWALTPFDRDGVAAEYAVVPSVPAPKPVEVDHLEAAAIPLPALSAWQGPCEHDRLCERQRVLIHGAAGAVGHFAVQLALDPGGIRGRDGVE
jgi:NADPH:quinone reductase-like Zn-dependent oxidoreductase